MTIEQLLAEFDDPECVYTRERFDADYARLTAAIAAKHNIPESEVDTLVAEHRYIHSADDPEDEYIQIMALAHCAGWLPQ